MSLKLYTTEVEDNILRENFFRIQNYVREEPLRKSRFRFLTFAVNAAVSNFPVAHRLKFIPLDVILLSVRNSDSTSVTWHYDDFTRELIYLSTDGPCTVRAYVGRYEEST